MCSLRNHRPPVVGAFDARVGLSVRLDQPAFGALVGVGSGEDSNRRGNEDGEYPRDFAGCGRRIHGSAL